MIERHCFSIRLVDGRQLVVLPSEEILRFAQTEAVVIGAEDGLQGDAAKEEALSRAMCAYLEEGTGVFIVIPANCVLDPIPGPRIVNVNNIVEVRVIKCTSEA